jgi:hypothetical protein
MAILALYPPGKHGRRGNPRGSPPKLQHPTRIGKGSDEGALSAHLRTRSLAKAPTGTSLAIANPTRPPRLKPLSHRFAGAGPSGVCALLPVLLNSLKTVRRLREGLQSRSCAPGLAIRVSGVPLRIEPGCGAAVARPIEESRNSPASGDQ